MFPSFTDLRAVIAFAESIGGRFVQYVVKYPGRANYNITMQRERAVAAGAVVVFVVPSK